MEKEIWRTVVFRPIRCNDDTSLSNNVKSGEFGHVETILVRVQEAAARKGFGSMVKGTPRSFICKKRILKISLMSTSIAQSRRVIHENVFAIGVVRYPRKGVLRISLAFIGLNDKSCGMFNIVLSFFPIGLLITGDRSII
jgi:hypothetical protein